MKFWTLINGKRFKVNRQGNKTRTDRRGEGRSDLGHPNWYGITAYTNRKQHVEDQRPVKRVDRMNGQRVR